MRNYVHIDIEDVEKLYRDGLSLVEIASRFGCSYMTIERRLKAAGVELRTRRRKGSKPASMQQLVHEYGDLGMTSYELAEKYGVDSSTIRKWMRNEGVVIGKGGRPSRQKRVGGGAKTLRSRCRERVERKLIADGGYLELIEYGDKLLLRCTVCGHEFEKARGGYSHRFTCPECLTREADKRRRKKYERQQQAEAAREWRLSVPRICRECGEPFWSEYDGAAYCSSGCRKRARNRRTEARKKMRVDGVGSYRRRMRVVRTSATYDPTVTLGSVYKKYHGICCQCGRKTYRTKDYAPNQATLDHIVALANNGTHTWDNVQLLCSDCNSMKRDVGQMRLPLAV